MQHSIESLIEPQRHKEHGEIKRKKQSTKTQILDVLSVCFVSLWRKRILSRCFLHLKSCIQ